MKRLMLALVCGGTFAAMAGVEIKEGTISLPSYAISPAEKSPVFDCKWSYQRARRSIYPYALNDNMYDRKGEVKSGRRSTSRTNG